MRSCMGNIISRILSVPVGFACSQVVGPPVGVPLLAVPTPDARVMSSCTFVAGAVVAAAVLVVAVVVD